MKPLGTYLVIMNDQPEPHGIDDDYDWHVRHALTNRVAGGETRRRPMAASALERIGALARMVRARQGASTARRA